MFLITLFTTVIYQPFLNILVFFYWLLDIVTRGNPDMGVAVIFLTLIIRFLLLPISLMEGRSESERRAISKRARELEQELSHDPIALQSEVKKLFTSKPRVVVAEVFSLTIQVSISLMLWRIFSHGLSGADIHLIYSFIPDVHLPFNLIFWGRFDLTHTSFILNLTQSLLIFILETISIYASPYPATRSEVFRLQLFLPLLSFVIFMGLPAGKKLFVITSLCVSIVITLIKAIRRRYEAYRAEQELKEQALAQGYESPASEKVVVGVK